VTGLLAIAAAATIGSHGVSARLPPGWHGRAGHGFLEAATVPLAPERGYVGTTTRAQLGRRGVLVTLYENTGAIGINSVRRGLPRPFRARDFGGPALGGSNPGRHRYAVRNFRVARRVFSLFAETGRAGPGRRLAELNRLAASLRVRSGDFYPGVVRPPRFARASGWHAGSTRPRPAEAVNQVEAWAATVPYLDEPNQMPPHKTLARLGPHDVAIWLLAYRDDRAPPSRARRQPPFRLGSCSWGGFEGAPQYPLCTIEGDRAGRYDIELRIFFGGAHPTRADRARAQAELDRLRLPVWPRF
jgi:hypothetical protein